MRGMNLDHEEVLFLATCLAIGVHYSDRDQCVCQMAKDLAEKLGIGVELAEAVRTASRWMIELN